MRIHYLLFPALLGFVSALPFMLVGSTLQAWGSAVGLHLMTIGYLTLIGLPYIYKFLWSPLLDQYTLPFFKGHRRGWVLLLLLLLIVSVFFLSAIDPKKQLYSFVVLAFVVAFFSATLDSAVDAFRIVFLPEANYGFGNASYVSTYRIGALVGYAATLIIADHYDWHFAYRVMDGLILVGFFLFLFSKEPIHHTLDSKPKSWRTQVIEPFKDLLKRRFILWMVLFIILYKFGEALSNALISPFLLNSLHFSLTALGTAYKSASLVASIAGGFLGGYYYKHYSLYATLFAFGILQALGILLFAWLAHMGHNLPWLVTAVFIEAFTAGMATTVFLSFMMRLCNPLYAASHFALLSACASLARVFTGPLAGHLVTQYHWQSFFIISALSCIPGLVLLRFLKAPIQSLYRPN